MYVRLKLKKLLVFVCWSKKEPWSSEKNKKNNWFTWKDISLGKD